MPKALRISHRLVLLLLAAYWLLLAVGTHIPSHDPGSEVVSDKAMHFGAFAGLAFLLSWSLMRKAPSLRMAVTLVAITLCYAAIDEFTQGWVPTREPDWEDWLADSFGAAVGLAAYFAVLRIVWGKPMSRVATWQSNSLPANDAA